MVLEDMVFKAISHPVRREIIGLLAIAPRSVKELTAKFEMSQPAISQHLKELKTSDLVTSERGHVWTFTSANNRAKRVRSKGEIQNGR